MKKYNRMKSLLFAFLVLLVSCNQNIKTVSPEKVGLSSDTLELASEKMQSFIDQGKLAGISTMVIKNGVIVQREKFGYADLENLEPIEENTIFCIFSMTKPVTAVALMTLYDEGKFELDDKISKYIPEFKGVMVYKSDGDIP